MIGFGVLVAGIFGFLIGSIFGSPIIGLIIGGWLGHKFDSSVKGLFSYQRSESQQVFFEVTFAVMGCIAKADGIISKQEINIAEAAMTRCRLNQAQRAEARAAFNKGKAPHYQLNHDLARFRRNVGHNILLLQLFLDFQTQTARADNNISPAKEAKLHEIYQLLGIHTQQQQSYQPYQSKRSELSTAYQTLGVSPNDGLTTIKRAYRKLMAEHHPDKLIAKGLPQEMIDIATEKTSKIQQAYRLITKSKQ